MLFTFLKRFDHIPNTGRENRKKQYFWGSEKLLMLRPIAVKCDLREKSPFGSFSVELSSDLHQKVPPEWHTMSHDTKKVVRNSILHFFTKIFYKKIDLKVNLTLICEGNPGTSEFIQKRAKNSHFGGDFVFVGYHVVVEISTGLEFIFLDSKMTLSRPQKIL